MSNRSSEINKGDSNIKNNTSGDGADSIKKNTSGDDTEKQFKKMEFQAVILANEEEMLNSITSDIPQSLLPIGNKPLIYFPLHYLQKSGFKEVIVVLCKRYKKNFEIYFNELKNNQEFQIKIIPEIVEDRIDTVDMLRAISKRIVTDFIVLSCNIITNIPILRVVNIFRKENCSLTMILKEKQKKKKKDIVDTSQECIGLLDNGRMVFFKMMPYTKEKLSISNSVVSIFNKINLSSNLSDCNFYIFKRWVMDLIMENKEISNIKFQLIPFIVKKQNFSSGKDVPESSRRNIQQLALRMSSNLEIDENDHIRVFPFIVNKKEKKLVCDKISRVNLFQDINRNITQNYYGMYSINNGADQLQGKKFINIWNDCCVGKNISFIDIPNDSTESFITVKKSNIGNNCKIGKKVKIINSVLFDNVSVESGSVIMNSIICNNVYIGKDVKITSCQVESNVKVNDNTEWNDETITNTNFF